MARAATNTCYRAPTPVSDTCAGQPLDDPWFEAQHVPLVPAAAIDHVVIEHAAIDDHLQRLTMPDGRHAARPLASRLLDDLGRRQSQAAHRQRRSHFGP